MSTSADEINDEVKTIIARVCTIPKETIKDSDLIDSLSADSIQLFELLLAFEKFYEIEAAYDDVLKLETVGDIVAYVSRVVYKQ